MLCLSAQPQLPALTWCPQALWLGSAPLPDQSQALVLLPPGFKGAVFPFQMSLLQAPVQRGRGHSTWCLHKAL